MKKLSLNEIRRDAEAQKAQMREKGINAATVSEYAEAMENYAGWGEFPEIVVFFDGKDYWPADGWQRMAAAEKAGVAGDIPATVKKGGLREAILYAAGANAEHGLRRTNADKRRAVTTLLKDDDWTAWSDGVIARRVKVSQPFVSKLRREFENLVEPERGEAGKPTQNVLSTRPAKRVGKDGVARSTAKIGKVRQRKKTRQHPCRKCGCTDTKPCPGGCYWVEDDLCSSCVEVKVTDKRRITEASDLSGPAPGNIVVGGKKEKAIAGLLKDKPLHISFTFLPKVAGVSVSVHRGVAADASRETIATSELPRMPDVVQDMIAAQLNGKGK